MSSSLAIVVGAGLFPIILLYLANVIETEHDDWLAVAKFFLVAMALCSLVIFGRAMYDSQETCTMQVYNATQDGNATHFTTSYNYAEQCTSTIGGATRAQYSLTMLIVVITVLLFMAYFIKTLFENIIKRGIP